MFNQWIVWQAGCVRNMGPQTCKTCISGYNQGGYYYCNRELVHFKVKGTGNYNCWL